MPDDVDSKNSICSFQVPDDLNEFLEVEAKRLMTSKSAVIRQLLDQARRRGLVLNNAES